MNFLSKIIAFFLFHSFLNAGLAQGQDSAKVVFTGYTEIFWKFDTNRPTNQNRPSFLYNHNRHNEFNVNLGFIKTAYTNANTRANLALAIGTYMADNYAAEPTSLKNIFEANVGLKLGAKTWLDAGILPSHIGFESAVSKDCWVLTRSIMAENSPYFEAGAKITHTTNSKLTLSVLAINGWQRIARINSTPAFGSQVLWTPNDKTTLNWSTYIGNERPDSTQGWRFFNNFYVIYTANKHYSIIGAFDVGKEKSDFWYSAAVILRRKFSEKWYAGLRVESYTDKSGIIINPGATIAGGSANLDFAPVSNALLRFELRYLNSDSRIFPAQDKSLNHSVHGTTSLSISF